MSRCGRECENDPLTCVDDDTTLSQYGEETFRNQPRAHIQEPGLSTQIGCWPADELCRHIFAAPPEDHVELAKVRYTTARRLRAAGFLVVHTPGRMGHQKAHVTVAWPSATGSELVATPWTTPVTDAFDQCFNDGVKGGQ
jgi:hypothetical protein